MMTTCEHCGTEYDKHDPDHIRAGGVGHLPWLCRDALKAHRDASIAKLEAVHAAWTRWKAVEWANEAADRRFDEALRAVL
jgi:hypothetical protein